MFSGGIEREQWREMSLLQKLLTSVSRRPFILSPNVKKEIDPHIFKTLTMDRKSLINSS